MILRNYAAKTFLSVAQAGILVLGFPLLASAGTLSAGQMTRVEQAESVLFGNARSSLSDEARLRAIETNLFGDYKKSGSADSRLSAVEKVIGDSKNNFLLPPIAPTLDTGNHDIQEAPELSLSSAGNAIYDDSTGDDRASQLLKSAMAKYSLGDSAEAKRLFKEVIKVDSNSEDAYFNLGVIAESEGDREEALANYRRAYQLNPTDGELRQTVDSLSRQLAEEKRALETERLANERRVQEEKRIQSMKKTVADASRDYKAGRYDQAISKLNSVAAQAPRDADIQFALGQAHRAKGDLKSAKVAFDRAHSIDPSSSIYTGAVQEINNQMSTVASSGSASPSPYSQSQDSTPAGQITPFTPTASNPNLGRESFSGSSLAQRSGFTRVLSGSKVKRAIAGGAVGAAGGAIWSATTKRSSIKSGAIQGALMGGLLGYLSGQ